MALTIEFEATGPTGGTLRIGGLSAEVGQEVLAAVERSDDGRWLTLHGRWSPEANWFPCPRAEAPAGESRFAVPAPLAAALIAAAGLDLRGHLRRFEFADSAPLRVVAAATAPNSGATPAPSVAAPAAPPEPAADPTPAPVREPRSPATPTSPATGRRAPASVPRRGRPLWPLAAAVLVLGAGALVWTLLPTRTPPEGAPPVAPPPGPAAVTTQPAVTSGRALAAALKARGLRPPELFREAETAEQAKDCEAAIRLFIESAKADAALADRLARRYDPDGFAPSPCFPEPKPDSAVRWYQPAAEAGIPRAQRRFGELLLAEDNTGPVYRDALDWLRKAAAAGDQTAAGRLAALGER